MVPKFLVVTDDMVDWELLTYQEVFIFIFIQATYLMINVVGLCVCIQKVDVSVMNCPIPKSGSEKEAEPPMK